VNRSPLPFDIARLNRDVTGLSAECQAVETRFPAAEDATPEEWLGALECLDLTSLGNDDTDARVIALAQRAGTPYAGAQGPYRLVAAVCVWPAFAPIAREVLKGLGVRVATVAGGFPHGLSPVEGRLADTRAAAAMDLDEIDIVIPRYLAREDRWPELYADLVAQREAANPRHLKVILSTHELAEPATVYRAAMVALLAGADFVKTSTGKEGDVADRPLGYAMLRAVADFAAATGEVRGFKAAGGIRTAPDAVAWRRMTAAVLGEDAIGPDRFRIGASALYDDLQEKLKSVLP